MQTPVLQKVNTTDQNLTLVQNFTQAALAALNRSGFITVTGVNGKAVSKTVQSSSPWVGGIMVTLALTAGQDNLVPHFLGFVPRLWVLARLDTNTTVWEVKTAQLANPQTNQPQSANKQYLNLWCGSNCNVSVWIN